MICPVIPSAARNLHFPLRGLQSILIAAIFVLFPFDAIAQPGHPPKDSACESTLREFLQDFVKIPRLPEDHSTRYFAVRIDLNDDKKSEVIVYLAGQGWCGSGGCTMLILTESPTFEVLTKLTIVRTPIRVLASKTNGWHDLSVWVQGGGIIEGYEAILEFSGETYPANPTVPPARPANRKPKGRVVIGTELKKLKPLYP